MHGDAQILILEWEADVLISSCLQLPCLPSYLVNAAYCCEIMKYDCHMSCFRGLIEPLSNVPPFVIYVAGSNVLHSTQALAVLPSTQKETQQLETHCQGENKHLHSNAILLLL